MVKAFLGWKWKNWCVQAGRRIKANMNGQDDWSNK
jgi:hypothetical protein